MYIIGWRGRISVDLGFLGVFRRNCWEMIKEYEDPFCIWQYFVKWRSNKGNCLTLPHTLFPLDLDTIFTSKLTVYENVILRSQCSILIYACNITFSETVDFDVKMASKSKGKMYGGVQNIFPRWGGHWPLTISRNISKPKKERRIIQPF